MVEDRQARKSDSTSDAFGQLIYDYHQGMLREDAREVDEREDGNTRVGGHPEGYFAPFGKWPQH
jgi:hypothetical protein